MLKNLFKITAIALLFYNLSCNATETTSFNKVSNADLNKSQAIANYTFSNEVEESNISENSKKLSSDSINYILVFSSVLLISVVAGSIFIHKKNRQN